MHVFPFLRLPLLLLTLAAPLSAVAAPPSEMPPGLREDITLTRMPERIELQALDLARIHAEDEARRAEGKPPRYAIQKKVAPVTPAKDGLWESLPDGGWVWRYAVHAAGATSVEPGFTTFRLPEGAALYVHGNEGKRIRGPYTFEDNEAHGQLWVPIVEGDSATIELVLEPGVARDAIDLKLTHVLHGYKAFWKPDLFEKQSKSCNIDVKCPDANPWRDQIRSVAWITIGGGNCSGQMINNTAFDRRPLFLTANHCGIREGNAASVVVYWNFENTFCRTPNTPGASGPGNGSLDDAQTGTFLLARYISSDFTLVELDDNPDPAWDVFWSGWDRRDQVFNSATGIHHPSGEEKRISFENDPLDIIDGQPLAPQLANFDVEDARERSHFRVNHWDKGVTEQGSSGSGLWNGQRRLVGQLHGGANHVCGGSNNFDWYGRLWMSWEGGGTAETRLRDYLDPLGTADNFIDGADNDCNAPSVSIDASKASPKVGETVTFDAKGGGSDLNFAWDLDGDGIADATGKQITARYSEAFVGNVSLFAVDGAAKCGTKVSQAVQVKAPNLQIANIGNLVETCGDGDDVLEPGERFELPITLANQGNARASNVQAVFTRDGAVETPSIEAQDKFGYSLADSLGDNCPFRDVDIGGQNNRVTFNPSSQFPANDDGGSDPLPMQDFEFYGRNVNSVVMSSNGYVATSATRNGGDFSNDCPLPQRPDRDPQSGSTGFARIAAFHDDLITSIAWSSRFDNCPRPPDTPGASGACRILQWNDVSNFGESIDPPFMFQAILYEGSNEIVFQYDADTPIVQATPTVGIQNNDASDGLTYGCISETDSQEPTRPLPETAVCFFHPKAQPPDSNPDSVELLTPALSFGDIPAGQNRTARLAFEVSSQAACGDAFGISLHGMNFEGGFSAGPGTVFTETVGGASGQCDSSPSCPAAKAETIDFQRGMFFNPLRDGHGVDVHTQGDTGFLAWFTYAKDRTPTWYLAVGDHEGNQIHGDLLRFTEGNVDDPEDVGEAIFTVMDEESALFHWTLDGEKGGEPFVVLEGAGSPPAANRTGHWFPPSQNGWGMTINQQGGTEFDVVYFYDADDQPAWTLGVNENGDNTVSMEQFIGPCPDCVWVAPKSEGAGTFTRSFSSATQGEVSTDMTLKSPREGDWKKNNVPIEILSDPID